jgi:hypothetical protein
MLDPETGGEFLLDSRTKKSVEAFRESGDAFDLRTRTILSHSGAEILHIQTEEDHGEHLLQFLKRRKQKR